MDSRSSALYHHVLADINNYRKRKQLDLLDNGARCVEQWISLDDAVTQSIAGSITKKYTPHGHGDPCLREKAIQSFHASNNGCRGHDWDYTDLLAQMTHLASRELGELDWQTALLDMRSGPGASVGSRGQNSYFEKLFVNPLTTTNPDLYYEYRQFMIESSSWTAAEIKRVALNDGSRYMVVRGSKLSTVPKNSSTDRTICTEPSLNMLFQLALGEQFNKALSQHYGYDKALQPDRNRAMACRGSIFQDSATIDLKNASDTIALSLCRLVLPPNWYSAILDCRSPETEIDGERVHLRMVSSMGNGFTFPLQTYLFSLLVKSLAILNGVKWERYDRSSVYGVFGDDIVVPTKLFESVIMALPELGFEPNYSKSFNAGVFRESCGTDWFNGVNVRGVYCKKLRTKQDAYSLVNRLLRWSGQHRIPLPQTCQWVLSLVKHINPVPLDESDTAGLKVPSAFLQGNHVTYSAYVPIRALFRVIKKDGHLRDSHNNPLGLMITAAMSACSSSGLDRRQDPVRYRKILAWTPNWDYVRPSEYGTSLEAYQYAYTVCIPYDRRLHARTSKTCEIVIDAV